MSTRPKSGNGHTRMRIAPPLWSLSNWSTVEHPDAALVGSRRPLRFSTSFHRYPARLRRRAWRCTNAIGVSRSVRSSQRIRARGERRLDGDGRGRGNGAPRADRRRPWHPSSLSAYTHEQPGCPHPQDRRRMLGIELLPSLPRADEASLACDCSQPLMALRAAQYRRRAEACLVMVGHNCGRVSGAWSSDYRPMALALKESNNSSRSRGHIVTMGIGEFDG